MKDFVTYAIVFIIVLILFPFICFGGGWLIGQLIRLTIGGFIVDGFALVGLNISRESLPLFFGTLSVIASFFSFPNLKLKGDKF